MAASAVWAASAEDRRRMRVIEMKCMSATCGVSIMDIIRKEEVRRRCGSELSIGEGMDRNVFRWYGHLERMEEERVVKRLYMSNVEGSRGRGRPKLRWMDGVKAAVERREANIEYATMCVQDRERWRREDHSKHMWAA
jgi:hypothetical protein